VNDFNALAAQLRRARSEKRVNTAILDTTETALKIAARDREFVEMSQRLSAIEGPRASAKVAEPRTYEPGAPWSFFVDLARAERGQDRPAQERLARHQREVAEDGKRRTEARNRAAAVTWEAEFYATPQDRRAVDNYLAAGGQVFEQRAMTRTDGQGGYLVPPAWLVDSYVPPARTGTELASLFTTLPLPEKCDTVNIPKMLTGTATGPQAGDLAPSPSRDLTDSFATGRVVTILGVQDAARQWVEQGAAVATGGLDRIIFEDLQADAGLQLDGQLWVGQNTGMQVLGLLPPQTTIGTSLAAYAPNSNTNASQQYSYNGTSGTALSTTVAQCISGVARARGKYPTHLVSHAWPFAMLTAQVDQQSRLLIEPKGPHPMPAASPSDNGVLGFVNGLRFVGDMNCPTTFGNASPNAPVMGVTSGAQFAPQAGTGTYTPILAVHAPSLYLWAGQPQIRCLTEVIAGSLQVRYQLYMYWTALVTRYQALTSGTLANSGGWAVGANSAYGVVTQFGSNSLLSLTNFGG
jgi:HK97 family phage major capsid protein